MTSINELIARATRTQHPDDLYEEGMRLTKEADRLLKTAIRHANAGRLKQAERKSAEGEQLATKSRELFAAWKKLTQEIYDEALSRAGGDKNARLADLAEGDILDDEGGTETEQVQRQIRAFGEEVLKRKDRRS